MCVCVCVFFLFLAHAPAVPLRVGAASASPACCKEHGKHRAPDVRVCLAPFAFEFFLSFHHTLWFRRIFSDFFFLCGAPRLALCSAPTPQ